MKRFVTVVASIVLVLSVALLTGCDVPVLKPTGTGTAELTPKTSATAKPGVLTVGIDFASAPFAGRDSAGEVVGIDVDIAAALAEQLGCTVEYVDVASDEADTALASGMIDIAMNVGSKDYAPTAVTTVGPYLVDGPGFFAKKGTADAGTAGKFLSIPDGTRVAAQKDSVSEYQVSTAYPGVTLNSTSTLSEAFTALDQGTVDYAAADAIVGAYIAVSYPDIEFRSAIATTSGIYIGVSQKNSQLASDVNSALSTIKTNGVLSLTVSKWIGSMLELPTPLDNPTFVNSGSLSSATSVRNS